MAWHNGGRTYGYRASDGFARAAGPAQQRRADALMNRCLGPWWAKDDADATADELLFSLVVAVAGGFQEGPARVTIAAARRAGHYANILLG